MVEYEILDADNFRVSVQPKWGYSTVTWKAFAFWGIVALIVFAAYKNAKRDNQWLWNPQNFIILIKTSTTLAVLLLAPFTVAFVSLITLDISWSLCTVDDWHPFGRAVALIAFYGMTYLYLEKVEFPSAKEIAEERLRHPAIDYLGNTAEHRQAIARYKAALQWTSRAHPRIVAFVEYTVIGIGTLIHGLGDLCKHLPLWLQRVFITV